ncbi:MAG: DUF4347 domain-containing protein, partial [Magnetococcales bacterium]|nr:DUF4347 domain-containing protein [Magnetococcales bacterium]
MTYAQQARQNHTRKKGSLVRCRPAPMVLEPRIMFDGAVVATAAAVHDAVSHDALAVPERREIVFIADDIPDYQRLAAAVDNSREVAVIDHVRDGLQQILDVVAGGRPVDAIHLVTHGSAGLIELGTTALTSASVGDYRDQLVQLGQYLAGRADLLVYGCDVAYNTAGTSLLAAVSQWTHGDIAASIDRTGTAGNWQLEWRIGTLETESLSFTAEQWQGALATTTYDANFQPFSFVASGATSIIGNGKNNNDVVRFNNVITVSGQAIDAVVTTTLNNATISTYDSNSSPSNTAAYFQPNLTVLAGGGGATFTVDFYKAGTYTGAGTGVAVRLKNIAVNSYDIDSSGGADRQYQEFKGFYRYELSNPTPLSTTTMADSSVHFQATTNIGNGPVFTDQYRVKAYYASAHTLSFKVGVSLNTASAAAAFSLDFSGGPNWTGASSIFLSPIPMVTYDSTIFAESGSNDGSITTVSTITLDNETFTGAVGSALGTVSNVPAGLTAVLTKTSATTATLSLTGNAAAHANANDVSNLTVTFGDSDFTGGNAGRVLDADRTDLEVNFNDPTSLSYSTTTFVESGANDGSIATTATITLSNDTFSGAIGTSLGTVTNVPAGLTAVLVKASATTATLTLTGNATSHANANDISNLTVTFANSDFTGGSAASVANATKNDLVIDFANPSKFISYSTTTFAESAADDGSISTVAIITLTGSSFTGPVGGTRGTVTNVPAGLTAVLIKTSATTAMLTLTGNATSHANANDSSNLTVTFDNGDFSGGGAAGIVDAVRNDLVIDFQDSKSLSYSATTLTESGVNDGSLSGSITITLSNDTFTGAVGASLGTVTNVPAGLTASLVKASATTATLTLTG